MIQELIDTDCIKKGNFTLKNGTKSNYYFDIKNIIATPSLIKKIGDGIYKQLPEFDIICGIPYGGLPIAIYISVTYNKPLIYIRDKQKTYGTQKLIEGKYQRTDRCIIIDDVITTGGSINKTISVLEDLVNIVDVAVVLDRRDVKSVNAETDLVTIPTINALLYKDDIIKQLDN